MIFNAVEVLDILGVLTHLIWEFCPATKSNSFSLMKFIEFYVSESNENSVDDSNSDIPDL